ncbi:MAG: EamA family transporter RarD [Deltaproteobacteria bacterium]|nr:EamA family transporter RarD [Deltaproteobacteria bacterium]
MTADTSRTGLLYGLGAYLMWGFFPAYWKLLQGVDSFEILAHRMVWSLGFVLAMLAARSNWRWIRQVRRQPRVIAVYAAAACFLGVNWALYIWAVNAGHVVETSLGYFINPLINVLFGAWLFGDRLRRPQLWAVGLAAAGVVYLTLMHGHPPWISLTLAVSFGIYGVLKKKGTLGAVEGLTLETAALFVPALAWLLLLEHRGVGHFGHTDPRTTFLLAFTGVATALPLVMFAAGVRRLTLTTVGLLQYLAPTIQFLLGVYAYGEPFSRERLVGFALIWAGLLVYSGESLINHRRTRRAAIVPFEAA